MHDHQLASAPLIEARGICKGFQNEGSRIDILEGASFHLSPGETVAVVGASGIGKSTFLHIAGMLDNPSNGEYFFMDEPVHKMSEKKLSMVHKLYIGFVFQQYHLIDELTVFENLETPLLYQKVKAPERRGRVAEILDRFNIVAKKDLFPNQLSGGQQQLVAVARAIITNPKLILADEPTGNLHSEQGREIMEILKKLNDDGTTIIQVTHSDTNAKYGNRIIKLNDGWIEK